MLTTKPKLSKKSYGYIYVLVCPITNKIKYVGQTKSRPLSRLESHKKLFLLKISRYEEELKLDKFRPLEERKITKPLQLTPKEQWFLELHKQKKLCQLAMIPVERVLLSELNEKEIYYIAQYEKVNPLTNLSKGGGCSPLRKRRKRKRKVKVSV